MINKNNYCSIIKKEKRILVLQNLRGKNQSFQHDRVKVAEYLMLYVFQPSLCTRLYNILCLFLKEMKNIQ